MKDKGMLSSDFKKLIYLQKLLETQQYEIAEKFLKDMLKDIAQSSIMEIAGERNAIGHDIVDMLKSAVKIAESGV